MLEGEGLLKDGCAVLADNVLKPGAPHFLWYLQHSPKYDLTVVSLREFAADRIEDWMALGIYDASAADVIVPAPKSLDRVAFLTDKARARSCNADGPCEVDEDAWARHAQEIRLAYDEVKIHPELPTFCNLQVLQIANPLWIGRSLWGKTWKTDSAVPFLAF
jgi:hypothetical protein